MTFFSLFLLSLIQGITEFLPVSSSGHLILLPKLLNSADQGPILDVALHVGTLGAVMLYFWRDVGQIFLGFVHVLRRKFSTDAARLFLLLALATIPVIVLGFTLKIFGLVESLRSVQVIGWSMLIFGLVLYWADRNPTKSRQTEQFSIRDAIIMGLWQALALIPGTSRSGATITASRFLGYDRQQGAKLAMLMSIPTIIASAVLLGADVVLEGDWALAREAAIAAAMSFVAALLALNLMMRLLASVSFTPYVVYRVALGVTLLAIAYT